MRKRTIAPAVGVVLFITLVLLWSSCGTVSQSDVGFQVGGGPADSNRHKVKSDLLKPGLHITGTWDTMWTFPAYRTLRFLDFKVPITTKDGKKVTVAGQVGMRFVGEKDPVQARRFAEGVGSRRYRGERPGESDDGWSNMLDQLVLPEIIATLKDGFGRVYCADFEPACRAIDPREDVPVSDPEAVYDTLSDALQDRVDTKLREEDDPANTSYLRALRVRVQQIDLPGEVQANIDRVTAEQAKTKAAQQSQQTAEAEAKAIRTKGEALRSNRDLVAVEVAKVCSGQCSIIVDASGRGVVTSVGAK